MKLIENYMAKKLKAEDEATKRYMARRDATVTFPEDVEETKNIRYGTGDRAIMDIYRPKNMEGSLPVLIDFHGGGLLLCEKEFNRYFCAEMSRLGFVVFNVEYPLAPDHKVFEILGEAFKALKTIGTLAPNYGGDLARVALTGDSAGGWLALYTTAAWRNPMIAESLGLTAGSFDIGALALTSCMAYTTGLHPKYLMLRSSYFGKAYRRHPFMQYTDPRCKAVTEALPPTFLLTGSGDYLREDTLSYAKALEEQNIPHKLADYEGDPKKLVHVFNVIDPYSDWGSKGNRDMAEYLLANLD